VLIAVASCAGAAASASAERLHAEAPAAAASAAPAAAPAHKRRAPAVAKHASPKPLPPSAPVALPPSVKLGQRPIDKLLGPPLPNAGADAGKDLDYTGARIHETHSLVDGGLDSQLRKAQRDDADAATSVSIGRTTSIDSFTGRPQSAKTEVKIGLTF
jgi:hypothetical protein